MKAMAIALLSSIISLGLVLAIAIAMCPGIEWP